MKKKLKNFKNRPVLCYQYSKVKFPKVTNLFLACLQGLASYEHPLWRAEQILKTWYSKDCWHIWHCWSPIPTIYAHSFKVTFLCVYWRYKAINQITGSNSDVLLQELQRKENVSRFNIRKCGVLPRKIIKGVYINSDQSFLNEMTLIF